jgi:hypothetical protein
MLRYHARTFQLLDIEPQVSPQAVAALKGTERRIGRTLPGSLREWYEQEGACRLLLDYSNGDPPVEIDQLKLEKPLPGRENLLPFRHENQGVCIWAVQFNGNDDPPVVLTFDDEVLPPEPCAASFSEHLYACVWDYGLVLNQELLVQAQNSPLSSNALDFLAKNFEPGPLTYNWPGSRQHRFSKDDQRILIWANDGQADWHLAADSEESLERLVITVWLCDQLEPNLWSTFDEADAVLRRLRE